VFVSNNSPQQTRVCAEFLQLEALRRAMDSILYTGSVTNSDIQEIVDPSRDVRGSASRLGAPSLHSLLWMAER